MGDEWDVSMRYLPETLVSQCLAKSIRLWIELEVNDAVHSCLDLYFRKVIVNNRAERARVVKVFFSHDFHIYGEDTGDTVIEKASHSHFLVKTNQTPTVAYDNLPWRFCHLKIKLASKTHPFTIQIHRYKQSLLTNSRIGGWKLRAFSLVFGCCWQLGMGNVRFLMECRFFSSIPLRTLNRV